MARTAKIVDLSTLSAATLTLVKAGIALADAENHVVDAFRASAVATFEARCNGASLAVIVKSNKETIGDLDARAYSGTVYTSTQGVEYHGVTGALLCLPGAEKVNPINAQDVIRKAVEGKVAMPDVKAALKGQDSAQSALKAIKALHDGVKDSLKDVPPAGSDDTDDESTGSTPSDDSNVSIALLIANLRNALDKGAGMTDADRAALVELAAYGTISAAA